MTRRHPLLTRAVGLLASAVAVSFVGAAFAAPAQAAPKRADVSAPGKPPKGTPAAGNTPAPAAPATTTSTASVAPTKHNKPNAPSPTTTTTSTTDSATTNTTGAQGPSMATPGYWLADATGEVGSFGGVPYRSSLQSTRVNAFTVDLVPTYDGGGYWLAGADGGVFAFGDAGYFGSLAGQKLNARVVALAPTTADQGYWLAARDGGVFAFGDAPYLGSPAGGHLAAPVVAMVATPDTRGYWLVSSDGGVFAYGDARYFGSLAGRALNKPIVGAAATADGAGYWLVSADGGVFAFGDAPYFGSLSTTTIAKAVIGLAPTPDRGGYWLAAADGGVFAFGDATFRGSASGDVAPNDGIVAVAGGPGIASGYTAAGNFTTPVPQSTGASTSTSTGTGTETGTEVRGAVGYDISWPQCVGPLPGPSTLAIVGINDGSAFTTNPCFRREAAWAGLNLSVYINLNAPDPHRPDQFANGPAGGCPPGASACDFYNYGYNAAANAMAQARLSGYEPRDVWLDVETGNVWSADTWLNDQIISGAISAVQRAGATPGLYSTAYQYSKIAGSFRSSVREWLATGLALAAPAPGCTTPSFTGGRVSLVQGGLGPFDGDFAC